MKKLLSLATFAALAVPFAVSAQNAPQPDVKPQAKEPAVVYFTHDISPEGLVKAYKALVIILIVVIGSPVVKQFFSSLWASLRVRKGGVRA